MRTVNGVVLPASSGFALGFDEETYHTGTIVEDMETGFVVGSLSTSGAKHLLEPESPAHFRAELEKEWAENRAFDLGHAAHLNVLGVGAPVRVVPTQGWMTLTGKPAERDGWVTKEAKDAVAAVRAEGLTPITPQEARDIERMTEAILANTEAAELLTESGHSEVSMWARDPVVGVWLRGRADRWNTERNVLVDYKTTGKLASPSVVRKTIWDFHYELQHEWYLFLAEAVGMRVEDFLFIFQEKNPPYAVSVVRLDEEYRRIGRTEMRHVIDTYAACMESGVWPAYEQQGIVTVSPPSYAMRDVFPSVAPGVVSPEFEAELAMWAGSH